MNLGRTNLGKANLGGQPASSSSDQAITGSAGIASAESFPVGAVTLVNQDLTGSAGIASTVALGTNGDVWGPLYITGSAGVASTVAVGSAGVLAGPIKGSAGIPSAEALGTGVVSSGTLIGVTGIPSAETFGVGGTLGSVGGPLTGVIGIPSTVALGSGGVVAGPILGDTGIPSAEALGTGGALVTRILGASGIPSEFNFGAFGEIRRGVGGIFGIPSSESFGHSGAVLSLNNENSNFSVYLNGALRTDLLYCPSVRVDRQLNFSASAAFTLVDETGTYFPNVGDEVVLFFYREDEAEWDRIFAGTVEAVQTKRTPTTGVIWHDVSCVDYAKSLSRRLVNKTYPSADYGTVRAIMTDLNALYFVPEGLTWVDRGGLDSAIGDIDFAYEQLNSALDRLAQVTGTEWQVDWYKNVYLFDRPALVEYAPFNVTEETSGNNGEVWRDLLIRRDRGLFRNRQYLRSDSATTSDPNANGYGVTKTYTFDTYTLNREAAFQYRYPLQSDQGIFCVTQDTMALHGIPILSWSPIIRDDTYRTRVYGIASLKVNGIAQTVGRIGAPDSVADWMWNDVNSRGASELHAADVICAKRINDPKGSPVMPQTGDDVEVVWILDSIGGPTATVTYTFSVDTTGLLVATEEDMIAYYNQNLIYWPTITDATLAGQILGISSLKWNSISQTVKNNTDTGTGADWILQNNADGTAGNAEVVCALRHYLYLPGVGSGSVGPVIGDTVEITWLVNTPTNATPAETITDWDSIGEQASDSSTGIWEAVDDVAGITDPTMLNQYAQSLLNKFGVFGLEVDFQTNRYGLEPGQAITVDLPTLQVSSTACNVESLTMEERAKKLLTFNARVSNQVQQRDAMTAFKRLIERMKKTLVRLTDRYAFVLAQTLPGITNPGLVTGTSMTNPLVITRPLTLAEVVVLSKNPPTGSAVNIDLKADGVSIFGVGYTAGYSADLGINAQVKHTSFRNAPRTLAKGTVLTLDVTQIGSINPGSDFTIFLVGYVA